MNLLKSKDLNTQLTNLMDMLKKGDIDLLGAMSYMKVLQSCTIILPRITNAYNKFAIRRMMMIR
ncbi:MAG: hypothetical protein ACLT16_07040 [[Clostridium] innocuum]